MDTLLGLDLGTHSIGWLLIETDADEMPTRIVATGARIFNQVLDDKTQSPKNEERRMARLRRRQTARRAYRREKLKRLLVKHGLLPAALLDPCADGAKLCNDLGDPYALRVKALTQPLAPHELGRVLLHLVQRRGFKSNRKTDRGNKDTGIVKEGIAGLRAALTANGAPTLGAHLAALPEKRRLHTARDMFEQEYEIIRSAQTAHFPEILATECKVQKRIRDLLYDQRPLKMGTGTLGDCQFETHRPRACKARLESQEFVSLQVLANLRIFRHDALDFALPTPEERGKIREKLANSAKLTWPQMRKLLQLGADERINLKEGDLEHLPGNGTAAAVAKAFGKKEWAALDTGRRLSLVEDLLTIGDEAALTRRLREHWQFDEATTDALLAAKLPGEDGYLRVSLKAVRKILPLLEAGLAKQEGCTYAEAVHQIYGANRGGTNRATVRELPEPDDLRNPAVRKVLFELRKVIHAIIRKHGVPTKIRIEMARDLKHSKKQRAEIQAGITKNKNENDAARKIITAEFGRTGNPSDTDVLRYRLWKELFEANGGFCPYTGREISKTLLFSDQIDIEHILPLSRSMDDSKANKTLCFADYNRQHKRNRTPWEACAGDLEKHAEMVMRARKLPKAKFRRFMLGRDAQPGEIERLLAEHATRQLQDTRYIARAAADYLAALGAEIETSSGQLTAALRRQWGLDSLLNPDGRGKNREDHRHHAVDAAVIACTTRAMVQRAARAAASEQFLASEHDARGWRSSHFNAPLPWPDFRRDLGEKIAALQVSHAPTHAVRGALHAETAYGAHPDPETGETRYHVRKRLSDLTPAMLKRIADAEVGRRVRAFFAQYGDATKARLEEGVFPFHADGKTPIKRARIANVLSPESVITIASRPNTHYESGSNHHVEIFENLDTGNWKGRFVTTFAAAQRTRQGQPVVDSASESGWRFVMSLSANDSVEVDTNEGRRMYRVQKMSSRGSALILRILSTNIVSDTDNRGVLRKTPNTLRELNPQKLDVTPLGEIRRAGG